MFCLFNHDVFILLYIYTVHNIMYYVFILCIHGINELWFSTTEDRKANFSRFEIGFIDVPFVL